MLIRVETPFGSFVAKDKDLITEHLHKYGAHTRNELAMVKSFISKDDVIFDVGAHIGSYAIPLAKVLSGNGKVYAFEPNPSSYYLLKHNIYLNDLHGKVFCQKKAIGEKPGVLKVEFDQLAGNSGSNTIVNKKSDGFYIDFDSIDAFVKRNSIGKVDWLKVDVEGREFEVLKGAENTLSTFKPNVYLEICRDQLFKFNSNPENIFDKMSAFGYKMYINSGDRNSCNNSYKLNELTDLKLEKKLYDVLFISES